MLDVIVIGAGAVGAAVARELSAHRKVALLEREAWAGYHSTGRSAAVFVPSYGNPTVIALTASSAAHFSESQAGRAHPLLTPKGLVIAAIEDRDLQLLDDYLARTQGLGIEQQILDGEQTAALAPILRPECIRRAIYEPNVHEIDVDGLLQEFLRDARALGAAIVFEAPATSIEFLDDVWTVRSGERSWRAPVIVNAAGAWAEEIARMAGVEAIGMQPTLRSAVIVDAPPGMDAKTWPMVVDAAETFYFKPEAGRLMLCGAEQDLVEPCDAQSDELRIAIAIDRVQAVANLPVRSVGRSWAGLRSFVPDESPVIGFDDKAKGFFWMAAFGGFGIQTSPASGRLASALIRDEPVPQDMLDAGLDTARLRPERLPRLAVAHAP